MHLNLSRACVLYLSKNGIVKVVGPGRTADRKAEDIFGFLPFHSTDTLSEADELIVRFCKLSQTDRMTYALPEFGGQLEDLERAGEMFEQAYLLSVGSRKEVP